MSDFVIFYSHHSIHISREIRKHVDLVMPEPTPEECGLLELDDTDSDTVIAQMLQAQFNREYDSMLKRTEDKFNGSSKGDSIALK